MDYTVDDVTTTVVLSLRDIITIQACIETIMQDAPNGEFRRSMLRSLDVLEEAKEVGLWSVLLDD